MIFIVLDYQFRQNFLKKTRLKIEYDYDFFLLGIIAGVKEYNLAWHLTKALNIKLVKQEDIIIPKTEGDDLAISNLLFETENSSVRLIGNRSANQESDTKSTLLPELQNFTHFFVLQDEGEIFEKSKLIDKIKSIGPIEYVVAIEPDKLKNRDNLIF